MTEPAERREQVWHPATEPPVSTPGFWSRNVIVVTNCGNVHFIAHYSGEEGGVWQRPAAFVNGEQVELWCEHPGNLAPPSPAEIAAMECDSCGGTGQIIVCNGQDYDICGCPAGRRFSPSRADD